jgi:gliding motility-associated protein GldL
LEKLSENASQLTDLTSAAAATSNFTSNMKSATESAQSLAISYAKSAEIMDKSVSTFTQASTEGATYQEQLRKISENLSSLNALYELQLQGSSHVIESSDKMQAIMANFLDNLERSTESTAQFTDQMSTLTNRMSSLNKVYGNMLTAMNVNA